MKKFIFFLVLSILGSKYVSGQTPILYFDFENNTNRTIFENKPQFLINKHMKNDSINRYGIIADTASRSDGAGILEGGTKAGTAFAAGSGWQNTFVDPGINANTFLSFRVCATGCERLPISFDYRITKNGPANLGVLYNTGRGWKKFPSQTTITDDSFHHSFWGGTIIAGLDGCDSIEFRIYAYSGNSSGYSPNAKLYLDNLLIGAKVITSTHTLANLNTIGLCMTSGTPKVSSCDTLMLHALGDTVYMHGECFLRYLKMYQVRFIVYDLLYFDELVGADSESYIITRGAGRISRTIGYRQYLFPLGTKYYVPTYIEYYRGFTPSKIEVSLLDSVFLFPPKRDSPKHDSSDLIVDHSLNICWKMHFDVPGNAILVVYAYWHPDHDMGLGTHGYMTYWQAKDSLWHRGSPGMIGGSGTPYYYLGDVFEIDSSCTYMSVMDILPDCKLMPVTFTNFFLKKLFQKDSLSIDWTTAQEENCDYFQVQKSLDGSFWNSLGNEAGLVSGSGTSAIPHSYSLFVLCPQKLTYYRLKQVDFNGNYSYSKVISYDPKFGMSRITRDFGEIKIIPNPISSSGPLPVIYSSEFSRFPGDPIPTRYNPNESKSLPNFFYLSDIKGNVRIIPYSAAPEILLNLKPGLYCLKAILDDGRILRTKFIHL